MDVSTYHIVCGRCECEFDYTGPFHVGTAVCDRCGHSLREAHAAVMSMYIDPAISEMPEGLTLPPSFR